MSAAGEVGGALTVVCGVSENSMRRVMSVGLGRGHVYIQEALNLEPLYLRLSHRVQVPVTHSSSSSFSLNY